MKILLNAEEIIANSNNYMFIDVRKKKHAVFPYENGHIPQAVSLDIEEIVSAKDSFLPEVDKMAAKLGELGITANTPVVIYDEGSGRVAAKAWYLLYYAGHDAAYILQGGYPAWQNNGGEETTEIPAHPEKKYTPAIRSAAKTTLEMVKINTTATLVDARAAEKYRGEKEPTYHKAGHIPGAVNFPVQHALEAPGVWKTKQELQAFFSDLAEEEELIVSCGSGNSACMNFVALKEAGFEHLALFSGGFSEWIEDDANEVETGEGFERT